MTHKNLVDLSPYPEPFVCVSCQENVCPAWKVDEDSGRVVCESCFTAARTNAARLSHIENLKVAFADVCEKVNNLDRSSFVIRVVVCHRVFSAFSEGKVFFSHISLSLPHCFNSQSWHSIHVLLSILTYLQRKNKKKHSQFLFQPIQSY